MAKRSKKKLRGVELVDAVMAWREGRGEAQQGADPAELAGRTLGDRPLTPALARWMAHDNAMFTLGPPQSFRELVAAEYGDEVVEAYEDLAAILTAPCVLFEGWGCDSRRLLYLGEPDAHGELPVITLDMDDMPYACINGPVDVWLAQQAGFLDDEDVYGAVPAAYEPDRQEHAAKSFGGYVSYAFGGFGKTLDPFDAPFDDPSDG